MNQLIQKVQEAIQARKFIVVDAKENDCGWQTFYTAHRLGPYQDRLDDRFVLWLNSELLSIMNGFSTTLKKCTEPYMQGTWFTPDERISCTESKLELALEGTPHAFQVFHAASIGCRQPENERSIFYFYPSCDFINLYMHCISKIEEIDSKKSGAFEYKCLRTGKTIKVPLVPTAQRRSSLFRPLKDVIEGADQKQFGVPEEQRHAILKMISEDIDLFGGSYNWTTGYRGNDIFVKRYNNFFAGGAKQLTSS